MSRLSGSTALVTGASKGFGRGIATSLAQEGASVTGVARDRDRLTQVAQEIGSSFTPVAADVTDPVVAGQLIDQVTPTVLVLNAGTSPLSRPLHQHTWESFSRPWEVDVRHVFHWSREALLHPLAAGSVVVVMSSGAAMAGSPLSGGYAGAKGTIRFIAAYAAAESDRQALGIRFVSVLPQLTPATDLGAAAVAAYAAREGQTVEEFAASRGPALSVDQVGHAVVELVTNPGLDEASYLLTAAGLRPLG